jgi:hypothetical protein
MPLTFAQWTGLAVTFIVISGTDMDMVYAAPLGIFAGAIATFCMAMGEYNRPAGTAARIEIKLKRSKKTG